MAHTRPESVIRQRRMSLRRDPNSLVASASIMSGPNAGKAKISVEGWQEQAWGYYDTVGELRFSVNWKANALSRVNLVAAIPPESQGDEPTPIDLELNPELRRHVELVTQIAGGVTGQGQMLGQCAMHLTVPGVGFILAKADIDTDAFTTWRTLSNEEVRRQAGEVQVTNPESGEWEPIGEADLLIKVWRAHPRKGWEPDSPVKACLPVLAEIAGITQRIAVDAESRLAGNGLLLMPDEAEFPAGQGATNGEEGDEFITTLVQVMEMARADRGSVAARVPLVARMPGETIQYAKWLTFWSAFDEQQDPLRTSAIRRLALGLDMPPEVLLGQADSNHWSAWQIAEEAITLHIEPVAETICNALTLGFLRAALTAEGLEPDSAIVWYDTTDLTTRPDLTSAAEEAHARIKISDAAYLREVGLNEDDAPSAEEFKLRVLLDVAKGAPTLAPAMLAAAGILPEVVAVAADEAAPSPSPSTPSDGEQAQPGGRGLPVRDDEPDDEAPEAQAVAAALLAASDGLVVRALERAGVRLRSAAGKGKVGGAASVQCDDPMTLHTQLSATEHASLDALLAGAWDRVPTVAARVGMDPESMTACLDGYCRGLLAAGHAHDWDRLAAALGVTGDRRLVAAHDAG